MTGRRTRRAVWTLAMSVVVGFALLALTSYPEKLYWEAATAVTQSRLDLIRERGEIIFVTRNSPTTMYEAKEAYEGVEYDLAMIFAAALNVRAKFHVVSTISEVIDEIASGRADIAAAGLAATPWRSASFLFSRPYQKVHQQVVCRRDGSRPRSVEELTEVNLVIPASSAYAEYLGQAGGQGLSAMWRTESKMSTELLLEQVWNAQADCTIADSNIVAINRRFYPELIVTMDLNEPQDLAWMMARDAVELKVEVDRWLAQFEESGWLQRILDRYYGHVEEFDYVDTRRFTRRIDSRLPRYRRFFEQAAQRYGFDWVLLAAQSYQESHWRSRARSPTGVRGIMMLTLATAREMGVKSRLDPRASIFAGARYLRKLYDQLPEDVVEPDRTWYALAAYNIGLGHLFDAMELAKAQGLNPYVWDHLEQVLPLLADEQYYKKLEHGYARGREPVRYVKRIRDYKGILERRFYHIRSAQNAVSSSRRVVVPET